MIKVLLILYLSLSVIAQSTAQKIVEHYQYKPDSLRIGKGPTDFLPFGEKGYTLVLPAGGTPVGTVITLEDVRLSGKDSLKYLSLKEEALKKGMAFLVISTGVPVDLYFTDDSMAFVDGQLQSIFETNHLPNKNIFFLGVMVSGHRALKYIEYCKNNKSGFNPAIRGLILAESAIDWVRQWYECQKQVRDHLTASGFFEGNLISYLFAENLKATPVTDMQKYIDFSPYSYFDTEMKKPKLYQGLSIRAYTYADIRYWFSAPGKGVYDSNYPDMSGFINEQKLAGNKNAELFVFHSDTDDKLKNQLRPQSSTWDLVDKAELTDWMLQQSR